MEEMDKLLEDLQKVNVDFNNQLSKYEALIYHTEQTNEKLDKYTESNREKVDRLCIRVEKRLEEMNAYVEGMFAENKGLIEQYAKEVLSIPLYVGMTEEEQDYVINALNEFQP